MADTQTTNLNLIKPEPGAAENTWGISLNSNLDDIDAIFASGGTEVNMRFNSANFDDTKQINFGTDDDANIRHDGNNTKFTHNGSGGLYIGADTFCLQNGTHDENFICMADNGAVDLYYDNVKKLETTANGVTISGDMVLNGTDSIKVSAGTTAQRNGSPVNGMFRYNTTTNEFEGYQNNAWGAIGGGGTTVNNNADNRIITGSSTADTLEAETDLTYTGGSGSVGTLEKLSSHLELKAANELMLNAGSDGTINFQDAGSTYARLIQDSNSDVIFSQITADKDIKFNGVDGSATITALTLDMSDAGRANFNGGIALPANTDIQLNSGTWSGEKSFKIQAHSNSLYLQYTTNFIVRNNTGNDRFVVDNAGNGTFTANVTAFSDERLKDNIQTLENGLDKVEQLRGVTYTRENKKEIGVIAQEVEKILPEIVLTANDEMGTKSVDYGKITSVLIEAIKELSARVKELENK
tara:strand:- start:6366 stop:7769 length:1404 start_codon:yes stop_codon:yes gene_type:complete